MTFRLNTAAENAENHSNTYNNDECTNTNVKTFNSC